MNPAAAALGLRDFYHVGLVVHDLDEAIRRFEQDLGVGRWASMVLEGQARFRGTIESDQHRVAFAPSGLGYIELVEPLMGRSAASEFLAQRGEGVYHIGFWVDDAGDAVRRAEGLGIGVASLAEDDQGPTVVLLDAGATGGVHVELVTTRLRPLFEAWVAAAQ